MKPVIHLRDYRPPAWRMETVELIFDLDADNTLVQARLAVVQDPAQLKVDLRLDGIGIELLAVRVDDRELDASEYRLEQDCLVIPGLRGQALIETRSRIQPQKNKAMLGLYVSGGTERGFLLTQCEAEGFRHITWSIDRPDVLARYTVTLRAQRSRFPVLLAGGDEDGSGDLDDGRHWARFVDPQPRSSYLFALVAGQLECIEDVHVTSSGQRVRLLIWAPGNAVSRCAHAMDCLKAAMLWDEQRFGRCYELGVFHVVATDDFTMGAMENTGLNIFNSKYLLADLEHATDDDFRRVLAIIGHEYFHNWSGNRVTCRDWFQLSLKEGLTVFREQEFESDLASRTLRRIEDVRALWRSQFSEDAGPLAHPVRPDHYSEINNFYTMTVYDKGAEIVRMLSTMLGREGFRRGLDLYFCRHDGAAVTVEDFLAALGDANSRDLGSWLAWYSQAGTPQLTASGRYNPLDRSYELTLSQFTPATPGQREKQALPIPVDLALFDSAGNLLPLELEGDAESPGSERVVLLESASTTLRFRNIDSKPIASLLRGYSAPVRLIHDVHWHDLAVLAGNESDGFNRWAATDALARRVLEDQLDGDGESGDAIEALLGSLRAAFDDPGLDPATLAEMLMLADESSLAEPLADVDPERVFLARSRLESRLSESLQDLLLQRYGELGAASEGATAAAQARRRLCNQCLHLLCVADESHLALARSRYRDATCLSDRLSALTCLVHGNAADAQSVLDDFALRYADVPTVMDKWFAVQALRPEHNTVERVASLSAHAAFSWDNPNKVHALYSSFALRNPRGFHRVDGAGYRLVGDAVARLDPAIPQVAARLAGAFGPWQRLEPVRMNLMRAELLRLQSIQPVSADLSDIIARTLGAA
ncbi:aminopeptidase N [Dokdonella sp.]|uniref:aminopeptidase N n=1 Tax=Dokdonella sp. TaxID=2291710 RepID=UPI003C6906A2